MARGLDLFAEHQRREERIRKLEITTHGTPAAYAKRVGHPHPIAEWLCLGGPVKGFSPGALAERLWDAELGTADWKLHTRIRCLRERTNVIPMLASLSMGGPRVIRSANGAVVVGSDPQPAKPANPMRYSHGAGVHGINVAMSYVFPGLPRYGSFRWKGNASAFSGANLYSPSESSAYGLNAWASGETLSLIGMRDGEALLHRSYDPAGPTSDGYVANRTPRYQQQTGLMRFDPPEPWGYRMGDFHGDIRGNLYRNVVIGQNPDGTPIRAVFIDPPWVNLPSEKHDVKTHMGLAASDPLAREPVPWRIMPWVVSWSYSTEDGHHVEPYFGPKAAAYPFPNSMEVHPEVAWWPDYALRATGPPQFVSYIGNEPNKESNAQWRGGGATFEQVVAVYEAIYNRPEMAPVRAWVDSVIGDEQDANQYQHEWKNTAESTLPGRALAITRHGWTSLRGWWRPAKSQQTGWRWEYANVILGTALPIASEHALQVQSNLGPLQAVIQISNGKPLLYVRVSNDVEIVYLDGVRIPVQ